MTTTRQTRRANESSALLLPFDGESSLQPGDNVRFYQNGWRYGTLESIENKNARVLYAGRLKTVPLGDVEKLRAAGEEPPAAPARHARSRTLR